MCWNIIIWETSLFRISYVSQVTPHIFGLPWLEGKWKDPIWIDSWALGARSHHRFCVWSLKIIWPKIISVVHLIKHTFVPTCFSLTSFQSAVGCDSTPPLHKRVPASGGSIHRWDHRKQNLNNVFSCFASEVITKPSCDSLVGTEVTALVLNTSEVHYFTKM